MRSVILLLLLSVLAVPAMAEGQGRATLVQGIIAGHIAPGYQALATHAQRLEQELDIACAGDALFGTGGVRQAYKDALASWMKVQHIRFGPAMADDRFYRFQYWPDKHGQGAKQIRRRLAGPLGKIPSRQTIGRSSVALQGFPALERILFNKAPVKPEQRAKACKLADAIGFNLSKMATQTTADWQSYAPSDPQTVVDALLRKVIEQLQIITSLKLTRPLGKSVEAARPRRAESWRSRSSLSNIKANLLGLRDLLAGSDSHQGLASVLANEGETLGLRDAMIEQLTYGITRIEGYQFSLHDAVSMPEGREAMIFLNSHLVGLRELIFEQLAPALGVNLGFNAQDGD